MMKRSTFLRKTAATSAFIGAGGLSLTGCATPKRHLTVMHTNDVHSHIDPFPADHPKFADRGGVARRATLIANIKKENPNNLLLDAGDIFQGTPYFNYYGGELEFKLMNKLNYDVATIGNHDFDNGIDGLHAQMPNADFKLVSANYNFRNTVMNGLVKPYQLFEKQGVKVGVFGLGIGLKGLVDPKLYKETVYNDPLEVAKDMVKVLRETERCDLVICLSHLGYHYKNRPETISDLNLAKATHGIDLIIGGHTHTFLPKPTVIKNAKGANVLVNQVGCYGINVGRIDFYFDSENKVKEQGGKTILV